MATVGIKELKNRLTEYLRRTKKGEEVVVTERGKPVALLRAIEGGEKPASLEARLARLAAQGLLTLPADRPLRKVRLVKVTGLPISQTILEDRR